MIYRPLTSQANATHMAGEATSVSLRLKPHRLMFHPFFSDLERPARQTREQLAATGSRQTESVRGKPSGPDVTFNTRGMVCITQGVLTRESADPGGAAGRRFGRTGSNLWQWTVPAKGRRTWGNWPLPSSETFLGICLWKSLKGTKFRI